VTVGIPGAGIGGLFYLAGALLAPARELMRAIAGAPGPRQWVVVWRHFAVAAGIFGGMAATGWVVGLVAESSAIAYAGVEPQLGREYPFMLARNVGMFTLTTLFAVISAVELLRLVLLGPTRAQRVAVLACVLTGLAAEAGGQGVEQAPAVEFGGVASGDTDGGMFGASFGADFAASDTARLGVMYQQRRIRALGDAMQSQRIAARFSARPKRDVRIDGTAGVWSPGSAPLSAGTRPEATFRLRRVPSARGGIVDVRSHRRVIDVTPDLIRVPVVHSQISTAVDVPVAGPLSIRAQGRVAALSRATDSNRRVGVGGGVGIALSPSIKVSGQWHHQRHSNPFVTGYFAPRSADSVEMGLEIEREFAHATLSLDLGGGVQRVERADALLAPWAPTFRGWGLLAWEVAPRRQFLLELEAYDSQLASTVSSTETWRYIAVTASMRMVLSH